LGEFHFHSWGEAFIATTFILVAAFPFSTASLAGEGAFSFQREALTAKTANTAAPAPINAPFL
jgi:hypothetical protein